MVRGIMGKTVAETIREISKIHLDKNDGLIMGQCLSAVGWVQNTVPAQKKGIVEFPMTDTAGAGFAVGAAVGGRKPIFILRFQSFLWLNASPLINNAAKSKEIFGYSAPVFIRAIASEGISSGPIHTNCYHSPFAHMPGLPICAPMTPLEYKDIWKFFLKSDTPLLVSEHRRSYKEKIEFRDEINNGSKISIFLISAVRFQLPEIKEKLKNLGIKADIFHLVWLKPFIIKKKYIESLKKTKKAIIIDSTYEICGISEHIAYKLMNKVTGSSAINLGMEDRSPGCSKKLMNGTPSTRTIINKILKMIN
jgi:acetoin:2,6-dichlorophenolindophenol oxidoreductase subunit beta